MSVRMRTTQDYRSLQSELLEAGALFADPQFPLNMRSLYFNGALPPHLNYITRIVWKRPKDMVSEPVFMVQGANRHDIDQGALGNCWFIAGAAVLASSHKGQFERVVPMDQGFEDDRYTGMFRFNFWWYGKWVEVIIDDYLPTDGHRLIFASNRERRNEFWPSLLEKAYAKLRGNYEGLDGGKLQDAMVDMTGGISEVIDIVQKDQISPELYSLMYTSFKMKTMMGACIFRPNNSISAEVEMQNGLYMGHAYSITGLRQIPTGKGTVNLLRLRNPWGRGEWKGPWSDRSQEMMYLSEELQEQLRFKDRDEGEFWMSYEDFIMNFHEIQFCHLQPDAFIAELQDNDRKQMWNVTVYHDAWLRGVTAGGCGNRPHESLYWKNPQFFITLKSPDNLLGHGDDCTLIVSLMEKEKNNQSRVALGFDVYRLKRPELQPLDGTRAPRNALLLTKRSGEFVFYREITKRFELPPGTYVIIPSTFHPHEEAEFMLRLFTEKHVDSGWDSKKAHQVDQKAEIVTIWGVLDEEMTEKPPIASPKDHLSETFERHAGKDKRLDAWELSTFLEDISMSEFNDGLKFPVESCRSLVTLMDENKSGFLSHSEVKRAWKEIKAYREVFKQFDRDNSNSVDTYELSTMFSKLGFPVSRAVLTAIVRRYGGRNNSITLPDFIMIICKLTSLFASFHEQQRKREHADGLANFTRNEFLEMTMFI